MTSRVTQILAAVFTTGLLVAIGQDYVRRGVKWAEGRLWPGPTSIDRCIDESLQGQPRSTTQPMTVVLTRLRFDADGYQGRVIEQSLREIFADPDIVRRVDVPCMILPDRGDQTAAAEAAQALAADIAGRVGADVVIWGEVRARDRELDLRLTHGAGQDTGIYQVEGVTLSQDFDTALGALVAARALSLVRLPEEEQSRYIVPVFEQVLAITGPLVADPPRGLPAGQMGHLIGAHARAQYYVATQSGDPAMIAAAVAGYRRALHLMQEVGDTYAIAALRNNLGLALSHDGLQRGDPEVLQEAVNTLRLALADRPRETAPLDWAQTSANLARALWVLGDLRRNPRLLREAVGRYIVVRAALQAHLPPERLAAYEVNLGLAQLSLGVMTQDPTPIRAAAASYRHALPRLPRESQPLDWAAAQNNLGVALLLTGAFTEDAAPGREALEHIAAAQEEWTRDRMPVEWARAEHNRGWALLVIGGIEGDAGAIRAAIVALHAALAVASPEVSALLAAEVHLKLAAAEAVLDEFEGDAAAQARAQDHAAAAVALYRDQGAHALEAAAREALAAFDLTVP